MAKKPTPPAAPAPEVTDVAPPAPVETPDTPPAGEQPMQDEPAAPAEPAPIAPPPPAPVEQPPIPLLDDYIAHHERAAQAADLVVTAISHPDAKPRHHIGVYSGFPVAAGPLAATYNDGTTH